MLLEVTFPYVFALWISIPVWRLATPTVNATEARFGLYKLLDEIAESHEPVLIMGKRANAVLISENDWRSIQETLHLLSIPGIRKSIREGLNTSIEECTDKLDW